MSKELVVFEKKAAVDYMLRVFVKRHPLAVAREHFYSANLTVAEIVKLSDIGGEVIVFLNGKELPEKSWKLTKIKKDVHVLIGAKASGGGSKSEGGKGIGDWIKIVVMVALAIVLPEMSPLLLSVIMAAAWFVLNLVIPPPKPKTPGTKDREASSQAYNVTAQGNDPKPYAPVIKVYGHHKVYPPSASMPFTTWHGDRNDLHLIYDLGFGIYDFEKNAQVAANKNSEGHGFIGATPISSFLATDIYWNIVVSNAGEVSFSTAKCKTKAKYRDNQTGIQFLAEKYGPDGNLITLYFDGVHNVGQVVGYWNGANPNNRVSFFDTGGTSATILPNQMITLLGGRTDADIIFSAKEKGTLGNTVVLFPDGFKTNKELVDEWNAANALQIEHSGGWDDGIVESGVIDFEGGTNVFSSANFKYYNADVQTENFSLKFQMDGINTRYSANYASEIQVDIAFNNGLGSINSKGDKGPAWVDIEVELGEVPQQGGTAASASTVAETRSSASHSGIVTFYTEDGGVATDGTVIQFHGNPAADEVNAHNIANPTKKIVYQGSGAYIMPIAPYSLTLTGGTTGQITFAAVEPGAAANLKMTFDGKQSVAQFIDEWNGLHPEVLLKHNSTNPTVQVPVAGDVYLTGGVDPTINYKDLSQIAFRTYTEASTNITIPMKVMATGFKTAYVYAPMPQEEASRASGYPGGGTYNGPKPGPQYNPKSRYNPDPNDPSRIYDGNTGQWIPRVTADKIATYIIAAGTTVLKYVGPVPGVNFHFTLSRQVVDWSSTMNDGVAAAWMSQDGGGYDRPKPQVVYKTETTDHTVTAVDTVAGTMTITPAVPGEIVLGSISLHSAQAANPEVSSDDRFATYCSDNLSSYTYALNTHLGTKRMRISAQKESALNFTLYWPDLKSQLSVDGEEPVYGKYAVKLTLVDKGSAHSYSVQNDCAWIQLRTLRASIPPVNPKIQHTFVEMYVQANERLNQAINNYNVVVTSILPICKDIADWDDKEKWVLEPTNNPAWIFVDILTGIGAKKAAPVTQLDSASIMRWAEFCAESLQKYGGPRYTCDFVLDYTIPTRDLLDKVCSTGRAALALFEGKYGVIIDELKLAPVQIFTPRNYKSLSVSRTYLKQPHALKVKWIDPMREWEVQEELVFNDGYVQGEGPLWKPNSQYFEKQVVTKSFELYQCLVGHVSVDWDSTKQYWKKVVVGTEFESLDTFGTTRIDQAVRFGRYYLANMKLRQDTITMETDIENLVSTRGDRVQLVAPTMRVGGKAARITKVTSDTVTIDDRIELGPLSQGQTYGFEIRSPRGISKGDTIQTADGTGYAWKLSAFTEGSLTQAGPDDILVVGVKGFTTLDCIIKEVRPTKNFSATITLQEYAPEIYEAADGGEIDAYDPKIAPDIGNTPPVPVASATLTEAISYRDTLAYSDITIAHDLPKDLVIGGVEIYIDDSNLRQSDPGFTFWKSVKAGDNASYTILAGSGMQNKVKDKVLKVKFIPVTISGKSLDITTLQEYSLVLTGDQTHPPNVSSLDLNVDNLSMSAHWGFSGGEMPLDLAGYRLRYSPSITAATWNEVAPFIDYISRDLTTIRFQARVGTYMLKTIDSSGNLSAEPVIAVTSIPSLSGVELYHEFKPEALTGDWTTHPPVSNAAMYPGTTLIDYVHSLVIKNKALHNIPRFRSRLRGPRLSAASKALVIQPNMIAEIYATEGYYYLSNSLVLEEPYTVRVSNKAQGFGRSPGEKLKDWPQLKDVGPLNKATDAGWGMQLEARLSKDVIFLKDWPAFNAGTKREETTLTVTSAGSVAASWTGKYTVLYMTPTVVVEFYYNMTTSAPVIPPGRSGLATRTVEIIIFSTDTTIQIADKIKNIIDGDVGFDAVKSADTVVKVTAEYEGPVPDAVNTAGLTAAVTVPGGVGSQTGTWGEKKIADISGFWTEWKVIHAGDYTAKMFQFRHLLQSLAVDVSPVMTSGAISIDMPERTLSGSNIATVKAANGVDETGYKHVLFGYWSIDAVTLNPVFVSEQFLAAMDGTHNVAVAIGVDYTSGGASGGDTYKILSKDIYGFEIQFYNSAGAPLLKKVQFDYMVKGYGKSATQVV